MSRVCSAGSTGLPAVSLLDGTTKRFARRCFLLSFGFHRKDPSMRKFAQGFVNFLKAEDGPTAVEYAVMLALIIVVCITAITAIGTNANKTFQNVADNLTTAS
jgi:pilus assembly protein Flp/PilA